MIFHRKGRKGSQRFKPQEDLRADTPEFLMLRRQIEEFWREKQQEIDSLNAKLSSVLRVPS
jgi:hypothetical protein